MLFADNDEPFDGTFVTLVYDDHEQYAYEAPALGSPRMLCVQLRRTPSSVSRVRPAS